MQALDFDEKIENILALEYNILGLRQEIKFYFKKHIFFLYHYEI